MRGAAQRHSHRRRRCRGGSQRISGDAKVAARVLVVAPDWSPDGKWWRRPRSIAATARNRSFCSRWCARQPRALRERRLPSAVSAGCPTDRAADCHLRSARGHANSAVSQEARSGASATQAVKPNSDGRSGRPRPLLPGHRRPTAARSSASSIRSCRISGSRRPFNSTETPQLTSGHPVSRLTAGYRTTTRSCIAT